MDLLKEVLIKILENEEIAVTFPNLAGSAAELIEMRCYTALQKIKAAIEDDSLDDSECFTRIEQIIRAPEELGSGGGWRHDF